jgi:two-component system, NarL family, nitrate/nitrite response regulator NarL
MRILIVDDHALFRDALGLLLHQFHEPVKIVHAGTADEALAAAAHYTDLDLILLDLTLSPSGGGLPALAALRRIAPTVPVVVVSASLKAADVRAALAGGAAGYVPKTLNSQEMLAALGQIMDGDIFVPPQLLAALTGAGLGARAVDAEPRSALTGRQIEVLQLLGTGQSNKEIARALGLTEGTVKLHVSALMRALGAKNRTEVVVAAERSGLLR